MPSGFQIWKIKNDKLKLLLEVPTKTWGIIDFFWIGDRILILEAKNINSFIYHLKITF